MAQYALESTNQPIGISEYELSKLIPEDIKSQLPSIEEIEEQQVKNSRKKEGREMKVILYQYSELIHVRKDVKTIKYSTLERLRTIMYYYQWKSNN